MLVLALVVSAVSGDAVGSGGGVVHVIIAVVVAVLVVVFRNPFSYSSVVKFYICPEERKGTHTTKAYSSACRVARHD